jgi:hypothetical protein
MAFVRRTRTCVRMSKVPTPQELIPVICKVKTLTVRRGLSCQQI